MGYLGREFTPNDDGNKGTGLMLEGVGGWWIRQDSAIGARLEGHSDDAMHYTDSSFTFIARFPVAPRLYLDPGIGLAFHRTEVSGDTVNGFAVALSGGYQFTRGHFACDVRFGGAHYRFSDEDRVSHGLLWIGIALGYQ